MSIDAIIGYTGFVGGTLAQQYDFSVKVNSKNLDKIVGKEIDTLVCAAAPGSMFIANRDPQRDRQQIYELIDYLKQVRARRFVLISSIAVFSDFAGSDDELSVAFQEEQAYGSNRRLIEAFVEDAFDNRLIVRLPALFGQGLRKNFIYDLLNPIPTMLTDAKLEGLSDVLESRLLGQLKALYAPDPLLGMLKLNRAALDVNPLRVCLEKAAIEHGFAATQFHNPETTYQYYNMNRLWSDIVIAQRADLRYIHLVTEPLKVALIYRRLTGLNMTENNARLHKEDMRTRHSDLWGMQGPYLENANAILDQLEVFYNGERRSPS